MTIPVLLVGGFAILGCGIGGEKAVEEHDLQSAAEAADTSESTQGESMDAIGRVHTLTFDALGTILDLGASHAPRLGAFLTSKSSDMKAEDLYARWRQRQRIEQYQDNQFFTGHFGYLDSSRRALLYTLRTAKLPFDDADIAHIMKGWQELVLFPDVLPGLQRLWTKYKLVVLSTARMTFWRTW